MHLALGSSLPCSLSTLLRFQVDEKVQIERAREVYIKDKLLNAIWREIDACESYICAQEFKEPFIMALFDKSCQLILSSLGTDALDQNNLRILIYPSVQSD